MKIDLHLGFTGTQKGMTEEQREALEDFLDRYHARYREHFTGRCVLHHGDCIGADEEAHHLAMTIGWEVVVHPGYGKDGSPKRAYCDGDEVREPRPYLARNRDIVNECGVLVAAPHGEEQKRSGTWATVRAARQSGKPVVLVRPDGTVEMSGEHRHDD